MNLDVSSPPQVIKVLEQAAQRFYEDASRLQEDWQDPGAGRPWVEAARALEAAATRLRKALKRIGWD
jgi:hypothetical protein